MSLNIEGNTLVKEYLQRILDRKKIPHSLLFTGPADSKKEEAALSFAKELVAAQQLPHPDIKIFHPEGKIGMHSIDTMRSFSKEVYLPPYCSEYKVFIIHEAERMLVYSANALLKTFEEPAPKSIIILISDRPGSLLPTVLSRCQTVRFQGNNEKNNEELKDPLRIKILTLLSEGAFDPYYRLVGSVKMIVAEIEERQEIVKKDAREGIEKQFSEGVTSLQQQAIDKEIEGIVSLYTAGEAQKLFNVVLSWYRDLELLHAGGDRKYLANPDFSSQIDNALQQGGYRHLEKIFDAINQAKLSLERSTPLTSVFENFFLMGIVLK